MKVAKVGVLLLVLLSGCQYSRWKGALQSDEIIVLDPVLDGRARAVLAQRCVGCHGFASPGLGGFQSADDLGRLVGEGWIRIGASQDSPLLKNVRAGYMPPDRPLAEEEITVLREWIDRGLAARAEPPVLAPPVFAPGTSELTQQAVHILHVRCTPCHNPWTGHKTGGGITNMRNPKHLLRNGFVLPGHSEASPLFLTVLHAQEGKAPFEPLLREEVETLRRWIDTDLQPDAESLVGEE